jgi:cytochrome c oxidase subunit 2
LATGTLLLSGCSQADQQQWSVFGLPNGNGVTDRAPLMTSLWVWMWIAALAVGVLTWGLIIYAMIRFRRRSDDEVPVQTRYHMPIEILYTAVPLIMVVVIIFFTWKTQDEVLAQPSGGTAQHTVHVVGQQWSWSFSYIDDPALGGNTSVFDTGTTSEFPVLWLPVNESVTFDLTSPDVIHSFWVPAFHFKMDVIPGLTNSFSLTPTATGTYDGKCAELCGTYHSRMLFNVKVVTADQYAQHLKDLEAAGNVGNLTGGSDATTVAGLDAANTTGGAS